MVFPCCVVTDSLHITLGRAYTVLAARHHPISLPMLTQTNSGATAVVSSVLQLREAVKGWLGSEAR